MANQIQVVPIKNAMNDGVYNMYNNLKKSIFNNKYKSKLHYIIIFI